MKVSMISMDIDLVLENVHMKMDHNILDIGVMG